MSGNQSQTQSNQERLIDRLAPMVAPLGYEIVHIEILTGRQKILRLFIDHLAAGKDQKIGIGIEDCAKVSRTLDEPLDLLPEMARLFGGSPYELEVSSPGIDRPLRQAQDYERFAGREARIHVYRPLTADELENPNYQQKNPRQKNFIGVLKGVKQQKVLLSLSAGTEATVGIPLSLIAKANLEPSFDSLEKEKP